MSTVSTNSLDSSLQQLECHFTWALQEQDVDLDDLEESIGEQTDILIKSNIASYNLLSYICYLKNSNEKALSNLQKAEEEIKKTHPDEIARRSLVTWGNYAWIYYHMERYEEAQTYVSKVENICKKLSSTTEWKIQLPEIYAEKGWALLKFGKKYYERAKESFENAVRSEANNPEFNAGYAIATYRLEDYFQRRCEDTSLSLGLLQHAAELDPEDTFIRAVLAIKLQDLEQVDEGERYIKEAMQKTPHLPYVLRYAAKFYRRKGEVDKALEILKKVLAAMPKSAFLQHQLGLCYRTKLIQLKKTTRYPPQEQVNELIQHSIFHFKMATEQKKTFFSAHIDLAGMYAEAKRYDKAEEAFQRVSQIFSDNLPDDDKQEFCYHYGNFQHFCMKSESKAIRYYMEGLKIQKDSYSFHKCRNALKKLLEQRIRRGLGDATDFGTLGLIHNLNGEKHEATKCYEQAVELCPDNEEYLSALCELRLSISS